jgi:2'-5' RNA ligase
MKIKGYIEFIKESSGQHEFGCAMIELKHENFLKMFNEVTSKIDEKDVYEEPGQTTHGIENNPHLTLLYGFEKEVNIENIKSKLQGFKDITIEIDGVDFFENENYDVLKFNVKLTKQLEDIHNKLSELPNQDKYPQYRPHITIAYLNKGTGAKHKDTSNKMILNNLKSICYSNPSGDKDYFELPLPTQSI